MKTDMTEKDLKQILKEPHKFKDKYYKFNDDFYEVREASTPYEERGKFKIDITNSDTYLTTTPQIGNEKRFVLFFGFIPESVADESIDLRVTN